MTVNLTTLEAQKLEKRVEALERQVAELVLIVARSLAVASSKGEQ